MSTQNPPSWEAIFRLPKTDFLHQIYLIALFRAPDPDGLSYYLTRLAHDSPLEREKILLDLASSEEYKNIYSGSLINSTDRTESLKHLYRLILNREPSVDELSNAASDEFIARETVLAAMHSDEAKALDPGLWLLRQSLYQLSKTHAKNHRLGTGLTTAHRIVTRGRRTLPRSLDVAYHTLQETLAPRIGLGNGALGKALAGPLPSPSTRHGNEVSFIAPPTTIGELGTLLSAITDKIECTPRPERIANILAEVPRLLAEGDETLNDKQLITLAAIASDKQILAAVDAYSQKNFQSRPTLLAVHSALAKTYYGTHDEKSWINTYDATESEAQIFNDILIPALSSAPHLQPFLRLKRAVLTAALTGEDLLWTSIWATLKSQEPDTSAPIERPSQSRSRFFTPLLDPEIATLTALSFFFCELVQDQARHAQTATDFRLAISDLRSLRPTLLAATKIPYPMGGGEAYMHDSLRVTHAIGMRNLWLSFADKHWRPHPHAREQITPFYTELYTPEVDLAADVTQAILRIAPDLIHSQGIINPIIEKCARETRTPALIGYHFWDGLVNLGATRNKNILKHLHLHTLADQQPRASHIRKYVASPFMLDITRRLGASTHPVVIPPLSLINYTASPINDARRNCVLQLNITPLKGGDIFEYCAKNAPPRIPFVGICAEPPERDFLERIHALANRKKNVEILGYTTPNDLYSRARIVIIPSLVDETFCRVAYEAAAAGIPVLSTDVGNIPFLLGDTGIYLDPDSPQAWVEKIIELYDDTEALAKIAKAQQDHVLSNFALAKSYGTFIEQVSALRRLSPRFNVGLYATLSEQGLGYQVALYGRLLKRIGIGVHTFSFRPYGDPGAQLIRQRDTATWQNPAISDTIYHSLNVREEVTPGELSAFARQNQVGKMIIPEICWRENWDKLKRVSVPGLFLYSVPNIETVRRAEIHDHRSVIFRNLCPTRAAYAVLQSQNVPNISYIGHGFGERVDGKTLTEKLQSIKESKRIRLLHVGGHNPISRKNTRAVIEAFLEAAQHRSDIELTLLLYGEPSFPIPSHNRINFRNDIAEHSKLIELYRAHDVSVQVSSHEGIGLGFYESLSQLTPVISLDIPPHNEIVNNHCGWLLPAKLTELQDNNDALWMSATFEIAELSTLLRRMDHASLYTRVNSIHNDYFTRFGETAFTARVLAGLYQ